MTILWQLVRQWLAPLSRNGYLTLWFLVLLIKRRNDVADVAWALSFTSGVDILLSI